MDTTEAIAERWIKLTIASYPAEMLPFLGGERDPFRNPVGRTLRENLTTLAHELLGVMDKESITRSLDDLVRLRAVQNFSPADAVRFVFELRTAILEVSGSVPEQMQHRIDELALMAFDEYMACREQILALRMKELRFHAQCASM